MRCFSIQVNFKMYLQVCSLQASPVPSSSHHADMQVTKKENDSSLLVEFPKEGKPAECTSALDKVTEEKVTSLSLATTGDDTVKQV